MNKRILYSTPDGGVAVIVPAPGCPLSLEEIAKKDVPTGADYWVVDVADIPEDRTYRNAWEIDADSLGEPHGKGA